MKVLLIEPRKGELSMGGEDYSVFEPLALEYLASAVRADHDVEILDLRLEDGLETAVSRFQPDVVGLTAYTVHVNTVKQLAGKIKAMDPRILTVVGGHHATVVPEDFHSPLIDAVVLGEGIFAFREILSRMERKKDLQGIPGTALAANGDWAVHPKGGEEELDALPYPDRSFTRKYRQNYYCDWMRPLASIRTSRGCKFKCNFCALWKLTGGKYLTRKPERILQELSGIEEACIFFADDESLLDAERMKKLARLIREAGIKKRYFLYGRSDTVVNHPDLIEQWKDIGLERVFVGLEFYCDKDLDFIRKGSTIQNNREAVKILQSLDIDIYASFMVRPEFGKDDFRQYGKHCLALGFDYVGFAVLTPLPGTDLYEEVEDRLITRNTDFFDFFHTVLPTRLPMKEFYKEIVSLYKKSRSVSNQIALLRKYPIREWPGLFRLYGRIMRRYRTLHRDYG
jgi:radical SAM superfamily enzyme YgiQ (UPF0313 family)